MFAKESEPRAADANDSPPLAGTPLDEAALQARLRTIFPQGVPNIYRMILRNPWMMAGLVSMKEYLWPTAR